MRVIEPHQLKTQKRPRLKINRLMAVIGLLAMASIVSAFWFSRAHHNPQVLSDQTMSEAEDQQHNDDDYRFFAVPEFSDLYQQLAYPNTVELTRDISITGDPAADARITTIALSRGFDRSMRPVSAITKVGDQLLQQRAADAWQRLAQAAHDQGVDVRLISGYRSIEDQRSQFNDQIRFYKLTTARIASGQADNQIVEILKNTAIPGYSRHHSGYTIDIACGNGQSFEASSCYDWLRQNNYLNAKKFGWIPAHPEGASDYLAEAESQEFSWVGKTVLLKR